ncbi:MAG: hypothetical protein QGF09_09430 [Rhodospirillales bacterium]|jgi:lactoylglutathione lyase|nr:hypothetical protein [Rhodospirillales bacterium]
MEINLIVNGVTPPGGANVLMDVAEKHPGYTHEALRVSSITETMKVLAAAGTEITQGPVTFGGVGVAVFVRDPDRNVIELRGYPAADEVIPGLVEYDSD